MNKKDLLQPAIPFRQQNRGFVSYGSNRGYRSSFYGQGGISNKPQETIRSRMNARGFASNSQEYNAPNFNSNDPRKILGFGPNEVLTEKMINERRRELAKKYHPDTDRNNRDLDNIMSKINNAADNLVQFTKQPIYPKWPTHENSTTSTDDAKSYQVSEETKQQAAELYKENKEVMDKYFPNKIVFNKEFSMTLEPLDKLLNEPISNRRINNALRRAITQDFFKYYIKENDLVDFLKSNNIPFNYRKTPSNRANLYIEESNILKFLVNNPNEDFNESFNNRLAELNTLIENTEKKTKVKRQSDRLPDPIGSDAKENNETLYNISLRISQTINNLSIPKKSWWPWPW